MAMRSEKPRFALGSPELANQVVRNRVTRIGSAVLSAVALGATIYTGFQAGESITNSIFAWHMPDWEVLKAPAIAFAGVAASQMPAFLSNGKTARMAKREISPLSDEVRNAKFARWAKRPLLLAAYVTAPFWLPGGHPAIPAALVADAAFLGARSIEGHFNESALSIAEGIRREQKKPAAPSES